MAEAGTLYLGLMSGTSIDAIDCALLNIESHALKLIATHEHPIPEALKTEIHAISHPGENEINRMGRLDRQLGLLFGEAANALIGSLGIAAGDICAIGSHGQTIRHFPASVSENSDTAFTLQIADPNTIAEATGIRTIADFRRRDIAAGGEGAPLAPGFHAAVFSDAGCSRAIINIGGIANATLLRGSRLELGFDSGPGNTLLDQWHARHNGGPYDDLGKWAASGHPIKTLLSKLLAHPYFRKTGPRSTGKELFNLPWLETQLAGCSDSNPADVQATLAELTCTSIAQSIAREGIEVQEVYLCGGGAHNSYLRKRLEALLAPAQVSDTSMLGIHPDWVEAAAFAWLAHQTLQGTSGNAPLVTGASGLRVLGGIYQP